MRRRLAPEMLSPGSPSGQTRMVTAAQRHRGRAKFAAPPIVHSLACSRWSVYRSGDELVNERKASFRSVPARQNRPRHPHAHVLAIPGTAMESPARQYRAESGLPGMDPRTASPGLAELGRRVGASGRTLSRLFRDEVGMGYTVLAQPAPTALGDPDARWGQDGYTDCQRLRLFLRQCIRHGGRDCLRANPGIAVPVGAAASATS